MDLNDYFDPVALEKPDGSVRISEALFGRHLQVHTPSIPIDEISNYQVAILGVSESRNSANTGSAGAPDRIRARLYELFKVNDKLRIIDLGNLKQTKKIQDTYFGLRDVMLDLLNNQVTALILGGTQDLTQGAFMAFELAHESVNLVNVDSRFDLENGPLFADTWLTHVMQSKKMTGCTVMGHQQYLVNPGHISYLEEKGTDLIRLGLLRSGLSHAEPYLRDAQLVSMDLGVVRQADAPATHRPSPNGLMAEEICQLARYAGMSDQVACLGLFEVNPDRDIQNLTAHLAAQTGWHFIEGISQRKREFPSQTNVDFKVFLVNHQDMEHALTFYRSQVTGRWWMEVPVIKSGKNLLVACTAEEYQQACNHDIPEMWWKAFQKNN